MFNLKFFVDNPEFCLLSIIILSLVVGSFLNLLIYRLPLMIDGKTCSNISLFLPRSFCPSCKSTIKARHNIPLVSYLLLKGICAYCSQKISLRYPSVEILALGLALLSYWHFGLSAEFLFALLFLWICLALIFIDIDYQILPDNLSLLLLWLGLFANRFTLFTTLENAVFAAALAYLSLWLFIKVYYLISGKIGMGNGDFKLFAAFGAWFGWQQLPIILMLASLIGTIVGLSYFKITKKPKDTPLAFGPFLCFSACVSLFWGPKLLSWYLNL